MPVTNYATNSQRIGKSLGEVLAHAVHVECLGIAAQNKKMPKNKGNQIVYRRWLPFGAASTNVNTQNRPAANANAHITTEGVTPAADTLTPVDISVALQQYACLYSITDQAYDLHEDDIPAEMKKQVGERMGLVREMVRYGVLKGATNAYYSGGTSRATVDEAVSLNLLRKIARNLMSNHAKQITSYLAPSQDYGTDSVEPGFIVFCHSDCEADIRDLPKFTHVSDYANRKTIHEMELGTCERFRFIVSPELSAYADSGAAVGSTGLFSTTGSNIDVYPMIVTGENAWGDVALRGEGSFDFSWIPPGQKDTSSPLGMIGYMGAKFYDAAVILNGGWMAVAEVGVKSL